MQTTRPLYFAAKISDYQFKKVLLHFTFDQSAAEAARHVKLSTNSIDAIYAKLRCFFFEVGLFSDPYKGGDPREGLHVKGHEDVELRLLDFHLKRVAAKRGRLNSMPGEPDYHFSESNWRSQYVDLIVERGPDTIHQMMYANLLEFVRLYGPVGSRKPLSSAMRLEARRLVLAQFDQRLIWLERNAARFRSASVRADLRAIREGEP